MKKNNVSVITFLVALVVLPIFLIGCGAGSGSSVTGFSNGAGYNISLTVPETIRPGGTAVIRAQALDPLGLPVPDGTKVTFSANIGTIDQNEVETVMGFAVCTYSAPKDDNSENPMPPTLDKVSAYALGALVWSEDITITYGF